jgi:hypothetical protein
MRLLCWTSPILFALGSVGAQAPSTPAPDDAHQVLWQRSLADAQALAKATGRPLLLAVNMDGESASDRIVVERYRDPAFVAATRHCVCLAASVFRHSARDHDDQGRRIPCPRLGEITCGEHMALEPVLYDKYLADGDRVAPRHALVMPDGKKAFDLSLCFDLRDIDRALRAALPAGIAPADLPPANRPVDAPAPADWLQLAARRDGRGRAALEAALNATDGEAPLRAALSAIAQRGDAGAVEALRLVAAQLPRRSPAMRADFLAAARALHLEALMADALRDRVQAITAFPPAAPTATALLPMLAELDGRAPPTRSLLLAASALAGTDDAAATALTIACGDEAAAACTSSLDAAGGPLALAELLQTAAAVTHSGGALPKQGAVTDAMPSVEELEATLAELDQRLRVDRSDAALLARYAKATLDLARRHLELNQKDVPLLLEDAARLFERALELAPEHCDWWLERARTAYFRQQYGQEAACGQRAFQLATGGHRLLATASVLADDRAIEALRWIGDGNARLLGERAGREPSAELAGMIAGLRALAIVAASPYGDVTDWFSFASFAAALGLQAPAVAIAAEGALRFPTARELRQGLHDVLWRAGRIDLAPVAADWLRERAPSATADWFAGYAWMLAAEDDRRSENHDGALAAYETAASRFTASAAQPDLAAECRRFVALTWFGRGMAHVRVGRAAAAADCLVHAVGDNPGLPAARDGLDCDVRDLIDRVLEWRESGPSPVAPLPLLDRLAAVAPGDPFWGNAISDSELREALRADGRNPQRAERDTVDAGGKPIRMLMGLPTAEGDDYLRAAIAAGRRAMPHAATDDDRVPLAQADTIWAERMLERNRADDVASVLAEAAALLRIAPPPPEADVDQLGRVAAQLRRRLGEARPVFRPGR